MDTFAVFAAKILGGSGGGTVRTNTTSGWNSEPTLISKANTIYVYSDYRTTTDEHGHEINVPGIKIGDGLAYLIDLPFADVALTDHMNDSVVHVTAEEKEFWNDKVSVRMSQSEVENIVFTTG